MKFSKRQRGGTMWEICFYVSFFLFVITVALKIGPLYIDDMNIGSSIESVHSDLTGKDIFEITNNDLKSRLDKNFQVSMISNERLKDVEVERTANKVVLKLNYEGRNNFMGNIDVVVRFQHEVNLAEPFKQ